MSLIKLRPAVLGLRPEWKTLGGMRTAASRSSLGSMHGAMIRSLSIDCNCSTVLHVARDYDEHHLPIAPACNGHSQTTKALV